MTDDMDRIRKLAAAHPGSAYEYALRLPPLDVRCVCVEAEPIKEEEVPHKWDLPTNEEMAEQRFTEDERLRVGLCEMIQAEVTEDGPESERKRLEGKWGQVWDTKQLQEDFSVLSFLAPCVIVRRKSDGKEGTLFFQHDPRFYFNFSSIP